MGPPIKPDRIDLVNQIFSEALELPPSEQTAFVISRTAAHESTIGQSVLRLLSRYRDLGDFLQQPACSPGAAELEPGELLAERFRIVSRLGRGGMGEVYRAEDSVTGETVALKLLRTGAGDPEELAARFRDEIRLARRISHPNVCRLNEIFPEPRGAGHVLFITMQFLDGPTLAARLADGPIPPAAALHIGRQLAAGIDAAHQLGIIHRDLKPANIILTAGDTAVITDFGLAHSLDAPASGAQTAVGQVLGTPDYMAPEQFLASAVSPQTDIFSFAMLFFEMVAGRRPFPAEDPLRSAIRRVVGPPDPLSRYAPAAPGHWTAALERALSPDPAARPRSASALVRELESGARVSRRVVLAALSVTGLASLAAASRFIHWGTVQLPDRPLLMLTPLQPANAAMNSAGSALDVLLANQLQQSAHLRLLPNDRIERAWQRIQGSTTALPARLEPSAARHIALREGAHFVLFGALNRVADEYRLDLNLDLTGDSPAEPRKTFRQTFTAHRESDLPSAAFDAATWIRATTRESEADLTRRNRAPAELTTSSWQALQEYVKASAARRDGQSEAALQHLHAALELDPEFALAAARLGDLLVSLHRYDEGLPFYSRAADSVARKNLTDRESLHIRGLFALDTGRAREADSIFARWCLEYPDEHLGYFYRATSADLLGFHEHALDLARMAMERDPSSYASVMTRAIFLLNAGRNDEAAALLPRATALSAIDWTDQFLAGLRFNRLDLAGVSQALEHMASAGTPRYQSRAVNFKSCLLAEQGRWDEAESLLRSGIALDERSGADGLDARFTKRRLLAQLLLARGRAKEAAALAHAMRAESPAHREKMQIGCLLAQAGDPRAAEACLVTGLPDWPVYRHWQKRLQGEIALARRDPSLALQLMQEAGPTALMNEWHWYLVRAAVASGDAARAREPVAALLRNPGRYWLQADSTGPGYLSWALARVPELSLGADHEARAQALTQLLHH